MPTFYGYEEVEVAVEVDFDEFVDAYGGPDRVLDELEDKEILQWVADNVELEEVMSYFRKEEVAVFLESRKEA